MRIATFNVESLDQPVTSRLSVLRPAFERLDADIVCLQEVNAQHVRGHREREFSALDEVLAGTRYRDYHRASSTAAHGGKSDVHNLVTLSRTPLISSRQVLHDLVVPISVQVVTAMPHTNEPAALAFDRPALVTEHDFAGSLLTVVNVHLRAPLASAIPGQKQAPFVWKSISGWAEGFYHSSIRRAGQALELRLFVDGLLDQDPSRLIIVAGDLNAEDHETPVRILTGASEDTGNAALGGRSMIVLDRAIEPGRRWSVLHHGRPQMLDHILASHTMYGRFRSIEVHNEAIGDEAIGYAKGAGAAGSYHAPVVATFTNGEH